MMDSISWLRSVLGDWGVQAIKVVLLIAVTLTIWWLVRRFLRWMEGRALSSDMELARRRRTTLALIRIAFGVFLFTLMIFVAMSILGIQLGPMLATAGVAGIAIGLGAQSLVRDGLNGFFLMVENRIRVGDYIEAAGKEGTVQEITLLDLVLRDFQGRVHIVPHGAVDVATNHTLGYSRAVVEIGVAYKENIDRVMAIMMDEANAILEDPEYESKILGDPEVYGIQSFGDSAVNFRIRIKTVSAEHWEIQRELRRRLKRRFDREKIEIPFPHHTLYWGDASKSKDTEKPD